MNRLGKFLTVNTKNNPIEKTQSLMKLKNENQYPHTVKQKPLVCRTNNLSVELIIKMFTGRIYIVR